MLKNKQQKTIEIDGWHIYDLPIKYSETDYQEARDELINKAKKTPGLIALFENGCIPALGISDMDFFAVFADEAKTMRIPDTPVFSSKTKYLMFHKIAVISEKHYRQTLYCDPWTNYAWPDSHRLLWQKEDIKRDLNFEKINFSQEERNILSAVYMEEVLESIYSNIPFYAKKELLVRRTFETIKDCVYIIEEVNLIADRKINPAFSKEFKNLRKNWFEIEQKKAVKKLIDILYQGLLISFEAAFSLADWLGKNCQYLSMQDLKIKKTNFWNHSCLDKKAKNVYLSTFRDRRIFTDLVKTPEEALKLSIDSYTKIKINLGIRNKMIDFYIVFHPLGMASVPLGLVSEDGFLGNNLRKDIFTNQKELSVFKPKIFQEKIRMINEITEIYNRKQEPYSDGKGFLYGSFRFGYLFEKEKLKRKLLNFYLRRKFWQTTNALF